MEEQRGRGKSLKWHEAEGRRVAKSKGRSGRDRRDNFYEGVNPSSIL